jgi:glycosyltransferase involved in cell wall biosynthesis
MQYLYIDYTGSIPTIENKFHGGNNYTKRILLLLARKSDDITKKIIVLWPEGYKTENKEEKEIRNSSNFEIKEIKNLNSNILFEKDSAIFFPLLKVRKWPLVQKIKIKNPELKVYITIHGLRFIDLNPDSFDNYYNKNFFFPSFQYLIKSNYYKFYLKKYLPNFDKVFTVSNHSLQQIIKYSSVNYINYYYQGVNQSQVKVASKLPDDYILFVSANRQEKNFVRAIKAFCVFKSQTNNSIYLYVTGINESFRKKIMNGFSEKDRERIEKWTKFYDYVEPEILNNLYSNCTFFLYTSRSEGFGLPVMEAVLHGKAVVASYKTSIPEVAGSNVYYVDPYSVPSIVKGIAFMCNSEHLMEYEKRINKIVPIMLERIKVDQENLLYEILN